MVDKKSLRESKRQKIDAAKKSMEMQQAEQDVADINVTLTAKEEHEIEDLAETAEEAEEMREAAVQAKKHIEAVKLAKKQVNDNVPAQHVIQRPSYGHLTATAQLHSHEAFRFPLGRNQRILMKEGKRVRQTRIVGLFDAAASLKQIVAGYQSGCPYAAWTLIKIEEQIALIRSLIATAKLEAESLCQQSTNLTLSSFTSKNPSEVPLNFKSVYAYHFADLLTEYDLLLRSILNYKIQHFISIDEYKNIEQKLGRPLRQLFRTTDDWHYVGKEAIEEQNAKLQEAEYRMGVLPKEIISGEKAPKFVEKLQGDGDE